MTRWRTLCGNLLGCSLVFAACVGALNAEDSPASPDGSFKIESVESAAKPDADNIDITEFVVSTTNPKLKEPLSEHPSTTHVSFHTSPDSKWIYESLSYGSRMNGGQLYQRAGGLKFETLPDDFEAAVWKFFGKEENIKKTRVPYFADDSHEGIIDFVAWSRDSQRLLLALRVGDIDGKRERGVDLWYLYFNTGDGKFELTDRLRAANKGAWKRRENFGDAEAGSFEELTTAESVEQSTRSKTGKK